MWKSEGIAAQETPALACHGRSNFEQSALQFEPAAVSMTFER